MSVMISIKPKYCELIASGKKTIEVRKTRPKLKPPFKCYIYCTEGEALAYPHLNKPCFHFMRTNNGSSYGRKMTVAERNASDCTFANGKVIGEFVCDKIAAIRKRGIDNNFDYCYLSLNVFGNDDIKTEISDIKNSCIEKDELNSYGSKSNILYGWHISDLVIYDKPKELSEFRKSLTCHRGIQRDNCDGCWDCEIKRPPQSWCYCERICRQEKIVSLGHAAC